MQIVHITFFTYAQTPAIHGKKRKSRFFLFFCIELCILPYAPERVVLRIIPAQAGWSVFLCPKESKMTKNEEKGDFSGFSSFFIKKLLFLARFFALFEVTNCDLKILWSSFKVTICDFEAIWKSQKNGQNKENAHV